ncbi:MAG: hydantoinase/oxoprolinase family protein [Pseudomonadota bacterium]
MARLLGIDTGGTYTDAVILDEDRADGSGEIVAKAKSLTTKHDLSIGIGGAVDAVLSGGIAASDISLVSISTTLATNALVEGHGGRVCLILIGFDKGALERGGLGMAVGTDPVAFIAGGHSATGNRQAPLDRAAISILLQEQADQVQGFAVVAHFGTRDPVDEIETRDLIRENTGLPVTCGHELASALGGPKRAVTTVLNARLIGMIASLIEATESIVQDRGISAPLMLVRGDGSLVSADFARARPIETILSGPAASLIGAAWLTGETDAVISDIGGTTTDIAILRDGRPALSPGGARVGEHETMVEAVDMVTHGLGGDSAVRIDDTHRATGVILGPGREIPISLLATQFPGIVADHLEPQRARSLPNGHDARFLLRNPALPSHDLKDADRALFDSIPVEPIPYGEAIRTRMHVSAIRRLIARGLVRASGFTPSDAAHVLGDHDIWNRNAAVLAAELMARQSDARGRAVAPSSEALSKMVRDKLIRRSAEVLLDAAIGHDGIQQMLPSQTMLAQAALSGHAGVARISLGLDLPLVGLGASAPLYYPSIARTLGAASVVPEHAGVANAVGAVVGRVRLTRDAVVTQPSDGRFQIHLAEQPETVTTADLARTRSLELLKQVVLEQARAAGAVEIELTSDWQEQTAEIEGQRKFIEGRAIVTATGRPRLA